MSNFKPRLRERSVRGSMIATLRMKMGLLILKILRCVNLLVIMIIIIIIIIIMNFYSPVSNTRCHSIGHKMRIAIKNQNPGRQSRDGKEPREGMQF